MDEKIVFEEMQKLAEELQYDYKDIEWLARSMYAEKKINSDGKNCKNYENDELATLGDAVLKFLLTEYYYDKDYDKGVITQKRNTIESNDSLFDLFDGLCLYKYAFDNKGFSGGRQDHEKVTNSKHNQYIEAIIGAVYKDKGIDYTKEWVLSFFKKHIPELID